VDGRERQSSQRRSRPHPDLTGANYTDGYQTTAAFLDFVAEHFDKENVVHMNAALRQGGYGPSAENKSPMHNRVNLRAPTVASHARLC
jgi:hypothetical protein